MTWRFCLRGVVQGVGFRPFVWRAALEQNLRGTVANGLEGVVVQLNGTVQQALDFHDYILQHAPPLAKITHHTIASIAETFFDSFTIEESDLNGKPTVLITPDVALCNDCRQELNDPANRRFGYAFTTCTVCGPRYSILRGLPYDRPLTSMKAFEMCEACAAEYHNPENRRFYAQTNSCPDCGITLQLFENSTHRFIPGGQAELLKKVLEAWQNGQIVAVKGIGGYLLTCDATNAANIATLRARKLRPSKPFALMYPSLETLGKDAEVCETARHWLQSPAAPIVLLPLKFQAGSGLDRQGIAPGLHSIGAMLPNAPLFEMLLQRFGKPIVATSGNMSHAPLIFEDEKALVQFEGIAELTLTHNRPIVMPQDDSVVAFGLQKPENPVVIRRARGLAPSFLQPGLSVPDETVLALGAEMKGTFVMAHAGNLNISQYLGDLTDFDTQERFQYCLQQLSKLLEAKPSVILSDLHPGYFSTQLAETISTEQQVSWYKVQHHEAHFAAVLAENNLLENPTEPILGIIWDGTGFGSDGQIWGGEFFTFSGNSALAKGDKITRHGHFTYFPLLLGDKMPREPRLSALAACWNLQNAEALLRPKFTETEWNLYQKLPGQKGALMTSSVGRLFDAVASLLGLADKVSFEGEAAMLLEDLARQYCKRFGYQFDDVETPALTFQGEQFQIPTAQLLQAVVSDLTSGKAPSYIAARFHVSLVNIIQLISNYLKIKQIAFSGGVFQNTLLVDLINLQLGADCQLFFHRQLSPNDENISFGQWAHHTYC